MSREAVLGQLVRPKEKLQILFRQSEEHSATGR